MKIFTLLILLASLSVYGSEKESYAESSVKEANYLYVLNQLTNSGVDKDRINNAYEIIGNVQYKQLLVSHYEDPKQALEVLHRYRNASHQRQLEEHIKEQMINAANLAIEIMNYRLTQTTK